MKGQPTCSTDFSPEYIEKARQRFMGYVHVEDGHWIWVGNWDSRGRPGPPLRDL